MTKARMTGLLLVLERAFEAIVGVHGESAGSAGHSTHAGIARRATAAAGEAIRIAATIRDIDVTAAPNNPVGTR